MLTILVDEEFGFRRHIWEIDKTLEEFVVFYKGIRDMTPFYYDPAHSLVEAFGGKMTTADETEDSSVRWKTLRKATNFPLLSVIDNEYSFLLVNGEYIFHAGSRNHLE